MYKIIVVNAMFIVIISADRFCHIVSVIFLQAKPLVTSRVQEGQHTRPCELCENTYILICQRACVCLHDVCVWVRVCVSSSSVEDTSYLGHTHISPDSHTHTHTHTHFMWKWQRHFSFVSVKKTCVRNFWFWNFSFFVFFNELQRSKGLQVGGWTLPSKWNLP